jgi:MFS family permease
MKVAGKTADFLEIFSPNMLKTTFWTCVLSIGAQGGYYVIVLWLPTFLAERNRAIPEAWYLAILIVGSFAGYLVSAWLSDHEFFKRRGNFVLFASGAILTVFAHVYIPADKTIILMLAFPLGFFASGTFSGMGAFFTELFPTRMRGAGVGFSYNFGRGFSALILWLVGGAGLPDLPQGQTPAGGESNPAVSGAGLSQALLVGMFVLIAYGLVIIAALRLRETRNEQDKLDTDIEEPQKIGHSAHQLC